MELINHYFPTLTEEQRLQFEQLPALYTEWNAKINVISRKDIDNLFERHILHSLSIAKFIQFASGSEIIDLGTGGGFPGIPLSIMFPEVEFHLVDSINKKLKVINHIAEEIGLKNVRTTHSRVEDLNSQVDFVVCRAVAPLDKLINWTQRLYKSDMKHGLPNGLIALKGGKLDEEIKTISKGVYIEQVRLSQYFKEDFFEEKSLLYVQG